MDIEAHRRQYLEELQASASARSQRVSAAALADAAKAARPDSARLIETIEALTLEDETFDADVRALLDTLADEKVPTPSRLAALRQLGAAEFKPRRFAAFHAEFIALLRKLAVSRDKDIRAAALERLTLTNDRHAQKLLRESLENLRKPLLPAAKAVQLLARDDHSAAKPLFRDLAANATGKVREEALRALASDAKSAPLFESIAANKDEAVPIRQIAAVNLKNTSATRFAKFARKLVLDDQDDDQLRAAAVSAITHTSDVASKVVTPRFASAVKSVGSATKSRALKSSISRFSRAHGAGE
jgi:hypothetical protein